MKVINKIKSKLLIFSVGISAGLLFPFFAHAVLPSPWSTIKNGIASALGLSMLKLVNFILNLGFMAAGKCLAWVGMFFDYSIYLSIQDQNIYTGGLAKFGWEMCRDMTNFIFVFALIFIGIATILQVQSYGFRKLLVRVILAALLVNFSATITLVIVDASNLISTEFLCKATDNTCKAENISAIIANSLEFQTVIADKDGKVKLQSLDPSKQALVYVFGIGLMLLVSFVFIAGAFMFLSRTFIIIFLLIFAPFAFLGTALGFSSAKQWWTKLFNQAIAPVVYFFLLYMIISYLSWARALTRQPGIADTTGKTFYDMTTGANPGDYAMVVNFIIMGGLLFGILIVSQQLGAMGSAGTIKMLQGGARKVGGYAGRVTRAVPRKAVGTAAAGTVAVAAAGARKMNLANRIMPITTKWNAGVKEKLKGLERGGTKKGQERTDKKVQRGLGLSPKDRAEYLKSSNSVVQKEMFNKMSARDRADMKRQGNNTQGFDQVYNKLKNDLSPEEKEKTEKSEGELQKRDDINRLKATNTNAQDLQKLHKTASGDDIKTIVNDVSTDGQAAAKKYFDSLKNLGNTNEEVAQRLEQMGNNAQASWVRSTAAAPVLRHYRVGEPTPPPSNNPPPGPSGPPGPNPPPPNNPPPDSTA